MRELKFRVWLPAYNQMIYPDLSDFIRGNDSLVIGQIRPYFKYKVGLKIDAVFVHSNFDKNQMGEVNDWSDDIDYVIQQYTGLKDKNNVEIYEGDIIENETSYQEYCSPAVVSMSVYEEVQWAMFIKFQKIETYYEVLKQNFNGIDLYEELPMSYFHQNTYKVIGNIFQNINLMKKG